MLHDFLPIADFHWLRPLWLVAVAPALMLFVLLLQGKVNDSRWLGVIDHELLDALLDTKPEKKQRWSLYALLCAWIFSAIALAGPSFEKIEQPVLKSADALVVLLDLSPSMLAADIKPSRVQAAHFKILDLLRERHEGYTALIAYSGSAHVVTPLSDDTNTIAALVNTLDPYIMPKAGSRVEDAVTLAIQLLHNANFKRGRLLLVTDGVVPAALDSIHKQLRGTAIELNVIGIGTAEGAPIPLRNGEFVKDSQGKILINPLDQETLKKLAADNGGYYSTLRTDDTDIAPLTAPPSWLSSNEDNRHANRVVENWLDSGYWLIFPCLLIALFFFRRGVVICILPLTFFLYQQNAHADLPTHWQDWWQTPDQQAANALKKGDAKTAAQKFNNPLWKAYAEYQNAEYEAAAENLSKGTTANTLYNRGNTQAKLLKFQEAIDSYNEALKIDQNLKDAEFNRDLVKKLLEQQKKQDKNDQKNKQDQKDKQDQQDKKDQKDQKNQRDQQNQKNPQDDQSKQQDQKSQQDQQNQKNQQNDQSKQQDQQQQQQQDQQQQENQQPENKSPENQQASDKDRKPSHESKEEKKQEQAAATENKDSKDNEKQQAVKQMLNVVPDDPGGLLRNKFDYYYQLNQQQGRSTDDNGEQRW